MSDFLIYYSHPCMYVCMYERGSVRVLDEMLELRTRPLLAWGCKGNTWRFFVVDAGGCGPLMPSLGHGRHRNCKGVDSQLH